MRLRVGLRHRSRDARPAVARGSHGGLTVDLNAQLGQRDGAEVRLTPNQFKLLARLVRSAGQWVTHRALLFDVWGAEHTEQPQYLQQYMGQLRAKLEADPAQPRCLLTKPGVGYRIVDGGDG